MLKLFKRIWRWLKGLFVPRLSSTSSQSSRRRRGDTLAAPMPLTDTDYEFLFSQLLEGVAHGWHEGRILKFFEQLEERGKPKPWGEWLERFGAKVLASPAPNLQLAARMMRFGELAQSFGAIAPIGEVAYAIARELYRREAPDAVWEYEGEDEGGGELYENQTDSAFPSENPETETLTLEELQARLLQDSQLGEQLAQQLGISSSDPQAIVEALIEQFHIEENPLETSPAPETFEDWFNLGLQQANLGDLEGAIASWEQALELNPQLTSAWHNRGSALGNLGRVEEAIICFEKAIELNPEDSTVWNAKGSALYNLQQWEEAIACLEKAVELDPNYYQAWYNRGSALESLGRVKEAIASYHKALEIQPDFALAQARLNELLDKN